MLGKGGSCLLQIIGTIFTVLSKMSFSCQWFVGQQITRGISQTNSLSWISFVSACVWKDSFQGSPNMQNCAGFIRSIFSPWLSGLLVWIWMCAMISPNHYWPSERLGHWIITPPKKSVPKGRRPEGATALRSNASPFRAGVPSGRIFWGGFERKLPKKIHNGSENSESQKKWQSGLKTWQKYHDLGLTLIVRNSG